MKRLLLALCFILVPTLAQAASCSSYPFTLQNNTTADATQVMANFNTVRNCVINNAAGSGVNTDITSMTGLSTPLSVPQGGTPIFIGGTSTGSANAQAVATTVPIGFSLTSGYRVTFIAGFTNTATATLNVNSTGATAVKKLGYAGLETLTYGEIVAGNVVEAVYDGTQFVLLSTLVPPFGAAQSVTATSTTDIGIYNTHNVVINGTTTITALGVTASVNQPVYHLKFGGALTLTYNATSLLIPGAGNITTAANDTAVAEFLGSGNWRINSYTRYSGAGIVSVTPLCGATGFTTINATTAAGVPTTSVDYSAGSALMVSTSGVSITATSVSGRIIASGTGANGLDAGSLANSTWYYLYLINNGTTTAGLFSTSTTAPTMPSGYIYKCLLAAYRTGGSADFLWMRYNGNIGHYVPVAASNTTAFPAISTASTGNPTVGPVLTSFAVQNVCIPANAVALGAFIVGIGTANVTAIAGPSTAASTPYSTPGSLSLQAPMIYASGATGSYIFTVSKMMELESANIGYASNSANIGIFCESWRMPVNAN